MKVAVILPAAGAGTRFHSGDATRAGGLSKVEMPLGGQPVFMRAIELFIHRQEVAQVILAVNPDAIDAFQFRHGDRLQVMGVQVVPGGKTERWETVSRALAHVREDCTHVAIHDAARPLTPQQVIQRVFDAARRHAAVIPGLPVCGTIKRVKAPAPPPEVHPEVPPEKTPKNPPVTPPKTPLEPPGKTPLEEKSEAMLREHDRFAGLLEPAPGDDGVANPVRQVVTTVDRSDLVEVQTPQVFERQRLCQVYEQTHELAGVTDDAMLFEKRGWPVHVVQGDARNMKITHPEDAQLAEALWQLNRPAAAAKPAARWLLDEDD